MKPHNRILMLAVVAAVAAAGAVAGAASDYESQIRAWREQRETRLKADGGWLTVAGLFWLDEGLNRFGTDPSNEIVLPAAISAANQACSPDRFSNGRLIPDAVFYE